MIIFVYTQLKYKTVLFQTIQFSISTLVQFQKQVYFKQFSLAYETVLFQTIQFTVSTQFSSIWPLDKSLSGATTPSQSGPGSDGNKGVLSMP